MRVNPFLNAYNAYNPELLSYECAWVDFIRTENVNNSIIKKEILESWQRCKNANLDPLSVVPPPILPHNSLNERIKKHQFLIETASPFIELLFSLVHRTRLGIFLIDEQGFILVSKVDKKIYDLCNKSNSFPGAYRSELYAGTNSSCLAIIHRRPFQIVGAEHYLQIFHKWACSSAPILDENGIVLGVLNVTGMFEFAHIHTLAMVTATAKAIENEIKIKNKNDQIVLNNNQLKATLEAVSDALIYINNEIITQVNTIAEQVLGLRNSEIIGKEIHSTLQTSPPLRDFLHTGIELNQQDIIIHGKKGDYSGFLRSTPIFDNNNELFGTVLIFTKSEEIRKMVNKIQKNSAYFTFENIIGQNFKFLDTVYLAKKTAEFESRVIIEGESGTGKEMFAQAIHNQSSRKNKPFIAVNCSAIPRELIESELFGYEEGSFTGARKGGQPGKFELADGGTIFLDEIGDMPIEMQVKLLRVLQDSKVMRVGGQHPVPINVRVIAATNKNLEDEVEKNNFREDLFYRLNVFRIKIPPLRERKDDIPTLVQYFITKNSSGLNVNIKGISNEALEILKNYSWPGNIRQLQNIIERALIISKKSIITSQDLPNEIVSQINIKNYNQIGFNNILPLDEIMKQHIISTLHAVNHNITEASKLLGISRTTIYRYLDTK